MLNIKVNLNEPGIVSKVTSDKMGKFIALEWKKLIDPFSPRDTSALMGAIGQTVDILPFELNYKVPYANRVYYGEDINFQKINPYSTHHWDAAAEKAGQKDKLYRVINSALQSGRI
jgi:hypothetical protein